LKLCPTCAKEVDELEQRRLSETRAVERRAKILADAKVLRASELKRHHDIQAQNHSFLLSLSPREFEIEIARLFRKLGYTVKLTPASNDKGLDAVATKDGKTYVIECKRYGQDKKIGRPALQKFFAAIHAEKAALGFFVTTSTFAQTAIQYAKTNNIELIDATALISMMKEAFGTPVDADSLHSMCLECGEALVFSLSKEELEKFCVCGSAVKKDDPKLSKPDHRFPRKPYGRYQYRTYRS
jgi:restriction endonuclease Mrr